MLADADLSADLHRDWSAVCDALILNQVAGSATTWTANIVFAEVD